MIALATLAAVCSLGQVSATEFFPMEAGMKWTYENTGDGGGLYSQEVGEPVDVGGKLASPLLIKVGSKIIQTTFYDVTSSGVYVLGSDPKKFSVKPQPVFQIDARGSKWEYVGPSPYEDDKESGMTMKGQSKLVGLRPALGEKRECLEVKVETKIGLSQATATLFKQTFLYAKGIGLVEMDQTAQSGKRTVVTKVKLLKFEGGKAVGL
jgi:hypothetical protein